MNWLIGLMVGILLVVTLLLSTGWWRYGLTGYLIVRVNPYEQVGTGAGNILFIGDSTGYGTGASRSSESIAGRLGADFPSYSITNNSVNGRTVSGALAKVASMSTIDRFDLVVLQIGANDIIAGRDFTAIVADMEQLITEVGTYADNIVVITAGNIGATSAFNGEQSVRLEAASRGFAQQMEALMLSHQNATFVPLFDEPGQDPFVAQPKVYTSIDGLHPTSAGYEIWYEKAKPYFVAALASDAVRTAQH